MKRFLKLLGVVAVGGAILMFIDGRPLAGVSSTWWGIGALVLAFILFGAGSEQPRPAATTITFTDFRPDWEKEMDVETRADIGGEDERYARELCALLRSGNYGAARKIGEILDANGGIRRMVRVCLRVKHLGGDAVMLERRVWDGIGEWQG